MTATTLADIAAAVSRSTELSLAVKATIALAAGLTIAAAASRARASVRHLVLAATLGSLLVLPLASAFSPSVSIVVPAPTTATAPASADGNVVLSAAGAVRRARDTAGAMPAPWKPSLEGTLRIVWAVGATLLLASLVVSMWKVSRIRRTAVPWLDRPGGLGLRDGDFEAVDLLVHEDVAAPFTCGVLRPALIFPPDARRTWSDAEIGRAIVHELEHVKRSDWAVQIAARATCAVYWFHPLAWVTLRKLSLEAERTCDDAAIGREDRTEYAEQLVSLAERLKRASTPPVLAMANRSDLSRRIASILDARQRRGPAGASATLAAGVAALACVLAIGPLRAVSAADDEEQIRSESTSALAAQKGDERPSRGDRALYRAAERGDVERMASLIAGGADVNAAIGGDGSPLIGAARAGRLDAVRLLLDRGADPNLGVEGDGSPLIAAAARGHLAVVELLVGRGALVDLVVDRDENPLIQASAAGQFEVVRFLVAKGANVNARVWAESGVDGGPGEWRTPLGMAQRGRHEVVAAFLRSAGARE
jgi:beta-lactamase regulating signal transducer with metallopeptidase domain